MKLAKLCNAKLTSIMVSPTYRQHTQDGFVLPTVQVVRERWEEQICDVMVMGSHGYGSFKQFLLGSETTRVLSHSKIPVLVCR